ncbi:MAG: hypothetical protein CM1200mP29_11840 [Verrucomicrobiota bacterium]|nr:MAG: hypothetical protein CM1200mP29_11840 [Verrucomicrobiota bacterium]
MIRSASWREQSGVNRIMPVAFAGYHWGGEDARLGELAEDGDAPPLFDVVKLSSTAVPWRLN